MKKLHIILGLIFFQAFTGCKQKQDENADKLGLLNSYRKGSVWKTDSLYLSKSVDNDTLKFFYKHNIDTLDFSFYKSVKNDSSIYLYGLNCPLVSKKTFNISNEDFVISKYCYDVEKSFDEESSFFYHEYYGLLVCFNNGWKSLIFSLEYDSTSRVLVDSILADRTGFYTIDYPPPPSIEDFIMKNIEEE